MKVELFMEYWVIFVGGGLVFELFVMGVDNFKLLFNGDRLDVEKKEVSEFMGVFIKEY